MKKIYIWLLAINLTSCFSINRPSYELRESYQIGNMSSHDVTISFYEQGSPKTIYAEIWEGDFASNISYQRKECLELWSGNKMLLTTGQTALIYGDTYYPRNDSSLQSYAGNMSFCGTSDGQLRLFGNIMRFTGDSATITTQGGEMTILPVLNSELWETWYDDKNLTYYHFWRIAK